ncbi:phage repressor protein C with HTH and peptisase S24 domain [Kushneria sinocarnis]|uniref:Phage repressor protein C with HTH and peptisase S24 domain n=1 Tax=Kushneria sinocarnis TaxID=595502 RepID=A0A420WSV7_9GAMM|nr:S24 family peptidase [Kushneria sinocarnis]RKQ95769.1 phage repressor protein C with HTH and peptisase S24 domain [Kushneria sinocarnis]
MTMSPTGDSESLAMTNAIMARMKQLLGVSSDYQLAQRFGKSTSAIHNWKKRGTVPIDECIELSVEYDASLDWLIMGKGAPPWEMPATPAWSEPDSDLPSHFALRDFVGVPLYDIEAAAGPGQLFDSEQVETFLSFRHDWILKEGLHLKDLVAVRVRGDSMDGTLKDGDTVLINRSIIRPDGVFLIRVGDELRIKRVQRLASGALRLSSDNDHYAPEIIEPEQLGNVQIIGHCYWHSGRVY